MPDAHTADEPADGVRVKHVAHHAIRLALIEAALWTARHDTTRVLASVLKQRKALANFRCRVDAGIVQKQTKDSTHCDRRRAG